MHSSARILLLLASAAFADAAPTAPGPMPAAPAVQAPAAMCTWIGTNRKVVRGRFLSMGDEQVVIELENGKQWTVPFAWFSPQSMQLVYQEAGKQADQVVAPIRDMRFCLIPHGEFTMGSPPGEPGRVDSREPVKPNTTPNPNPKPVPEWEPEHKVDISKDFWLKATEVSWAEWNLVLKLAPNHGYSDIAPGRNGYMGDITGTHPVTEVSWWDAIKWCNLKSQIEGKTPVYYTTAALNTPLKTGNLVVFVKWNASGYRLPTEAEWEFACRGGRDRGGREFHTGKISQPGVVPLDSNLNEAGWYAGNSHMDTLPVAAAPPALSPTTPQGFPWSRMNTHPVAGKKPNKYGLHDMHGNVAEWCWDWEGMLTSDKARDPRGPEKGDFRIFRGGCWADPAKCCRAAYRGTLSPRAPASCLTGFRPACGSDPRKREPANKERSRP
jgi:formylglycine-generating enzyme required for sulfatase activity